MEQAKPLSLSERPKRGRGRQIQAAGGYLSLSFQLWAGIVTMTKSLRRVDGAALCVHSHVDSEEEARWGQQLCPAAGL
jgi:hypothetical protein